MIALAASLCLSAAFALRGLRRGALDPSGAAAALIVGAIHMSSGFELGSTLIAFYLTSSKLTKWRYELKARLEAGHAVGGRRGAGQVLANSLLGAVLSAAVAALCQGRVGGGEDGLAAARLACAFVGFYACCCADTWSSEAGIAAAAPPRLVTTWRKVPPGTNGAVSQFGTAAAAAGGLLVGCVFWAAAQLPGLLGFGGGGKGAACWRQAAGDWRLLPLALVAGLAGSLLDSLLGATLQWSGFDERSGKAVSGRPGGEAAAAAAGVKHVSGRDVLSNTQVNIVSSAVTSLLAAALGARFLGPCSA